MARPPKNQEFDEPIDGLPDLPEPVVDGRANPEYYRERMRRLSMIADEYSRRGVAFSGFDQHIKGIKHEAELHGLEPKSILDSRSDAQIFEDCLTKLLEHPESVFEQSDRELTAIEKGMERVDALVSEWFDEECKKAGEKGLKKKLTKEQIKQVQNMGKAVRSRIQRVMRLRNLARNPIPKGTHPTKRMKVEAGHTLRFMLYVGRSQADGLGIDGTHIFDIGSPHARMAIADWEMRNGVRFSAEGAQRGVIPYEGVIIVMHPGCGKSEYGMHSEILLTNQNPQRQLLLVHAQSDVACEMKSYMAKCYDVGESVGRRNIALFPNLELHHRDNNAHSMRLIVNGVTNRAPTVKAVGAGEKKSGISATDIYIDDPVDETERDSETDRIRKWRRIENTWLSRKRGHVGRIRWITTLWHEDDASCRKIRQAMLAAKTGGRQGVMWRVLRIGAGGPSKKFEPVWERAYGKRYLKNKYQSMGPQDYATVYECNPSSRDAAIVKRVALYAPTNPDGTSNEQHQRFLGGAVRHISIDPAGTNRMQSDRAGIVYGAIGYMSWLGEDGDGAPVEQMVMRLRILDAMRLQSNQSELVQWVADFAQRQTVHYVHVETVSGYAATAEMLENEYDIDVIRHYPTPNGKKETRLRHCSIMLENSQRDKGIIPVIEFPGKWADERTVCPECGAADNHVDDVRLVCDSCGKIVDRLVPDDSCRWLVDQLVRFGTTGEDDGVDAVTQLALHLAPDLGIGEGVASRLIRSQQLDRNTRKLKLIERINRSGGSDNPDDDEYRWLHDER